MIRSILKGVCERATEASHLAAPATAAIKVAKAANAAANFAKVSSLISLYAAHASVGKATLRDRKEKLDFYTRNVGRYSRRALEAMNFEIEVIGRDEKLLSEKNFLMVGNHMSYLDILVLSSIQPTVFVTSIDMGEVFFLGTMAELGGSIFIERRHRGQVDQDLKVMAETLRDGFNVMIYPEGTSSNGLQVLPFKKSLLMSAVQAERDILPVVIKYAEIDGKPFGPDNCDKVCWYGDLTFPPHFLGLMSLKKVKVEVHYLDPIEVRPDSDRKELAAKAYNAINAVYMADKPWARPASDVPEAGEAGVSTPHESAQA